MPLQKVASTQGTNLAPALLVDGDGGSAAYRGNLPAFTTTSVWLLLNWDFWKMLTSFHALQDQSGL